MMSHISRGKSAHAYGKRRQQPRRSFFNRYIVRASSYCFIIIHLYYLHHLLAPLTECLPKSIPQTEAETYAEALSLWTCSESTAREIVPRIWYNELYFKWKRGKTLLQSLSNLWFKPSSAFMLFGTIYFAFITVMFVERVLWYSVHVFLYIANVVLSLLHLKPVVLALLEKSGLLRRQQRSLRMESACPHPCAVEHSEETATTTTAAASAERAACCDATHNTYPRCTQPRQRPAPPLIWLLRYGNSYDVLLRFSITVLELLWFRQHINSGALQKGVAFFASAQIPLESLSVSVSVITLTYGAMGLLCAMAMMDIQRLFDVMINGSSLEVPNGCDQCPLCFATWKRGVRSAHFPAHRCQVLWPGEYRHHQQQLRLHRRAALAVAPVAASVWRRCFRQCRTRVAHVERGDEANAPGDARVNGGADMIPQRRPGDAFPSRDTASLWSALSYSWLTQLVHLSRISVYGDFGPPAAKAYADSGNELWKAQRAVVARLPPLPAHFDARRCVAAPAWWLWCNRHRVGDAHTRRDGETAVDSPNHDKHACKTNDEDGVLPRRSRLEMLFLYITGPLRRFLTRLFRLVFLPSRRVAQVDRRVHSSSSSSSSPVHAQRRSWWPARWRRPRADTRACGDAGQTDAHETASEHTAAGLFQLFLEHPIGREYVWVCAPMKLAEDALSLLTPLAVRHLVMFLRQVGLRSTPDPYAHLGRGLLICAALIVCVVGQNIIFQYYLEHLFSTTIRASSALTALIVQHTLHIPVAYSGTTTTTATASASHDGAKTHESVGAANTASVAVAAAVVRAGGAGAVSSSVDHQTVLPATVASATHTRAPEDDSAKHEPNNNNSTADKSRHERECSAHGAQSRMDSSIASTATTASTRTTSASEPTHPSTLSREGEVVSLMTVDAQNCATCLVFLHNVWGHPIILLSSFATMYSYVGMGSTLATIAAVVLLTPINRYCANRVRAAQQSAKNNSARISDLNTALASMRTVKGMALERSLLRRIAAAREQERLGIARIGWADSIVAAQAELMTLITTLVCCGSYLLGGGKMDAGVLVPTMAALNVMSFPLLTLPNIFAQVSRGYTSMKRIEHYLHRDGGLCQTSVRLLHPPPPTTTTPVTVHEQPLPQGGALSRGSVVCRGCSFSWTPPAAHPHPIVHPSHPTSNVGVHCESYAASPQEKVAGGWMKHTPHSLLPDAFGENHDAGDNSSPIAAAAAANHHDEPATVLNDVWLDVKPGEFVLVRGSTGSGKSALLLAILGELFPVPRHDSSTIHHLPRARDHVSAHPSPSHSPRNNTNNHRDSIPHSPSSPRHSSPSHSSSPALVAGEFTRVANACDTFDSARSWSAAAAAAVGGCVVAGRVVYCGEVPWLRHQSIRENIRMRPDTAPETEEERVWYETVLEACALTRDVACMPRGDRTDVGEGGSKLSGGQRARVAIARAVWALPDTDVYVMDDVLSALDVDVQRHIIEHVFHGLLRGHNQPWAAQRRNNEEEKCDEKEDKPAWQPLASHETTAAAHRVPTIILSTHVPAEAVGPDRVLELGLEGNVTEHASLVSSPSTSFASTLLLHASSPPNELTSTSSRERSTSDELVGQRAIIPAAKKQSHNHAHTRAPPGTADDALCSPIQPRPAQEGHSVEEVAEGSPRTLVARHAHGPTASSCSAARHHEVPFATSLSDLMQRAVPAKQLELTAAKSGPTSPVSVVPTLPLVHATENSNKARKKRVRRGRRASRCRHKRGEAGQTTGRVGRHAPPPPTTTAVIRADANRDDDGRRKDFMSSAVRDFSLFPPGEDVRLLLMDYMGVGRVLLVLLTTALVQLFHILMQNWMGIWFSRNSVEPVEVVNRTAMQNLQHLFFKVIERAAAATTGSPVRTSASSSLSPPASTAVVAVPHAAATMSALWRLPLNWKALPWSTSASVMWQVWRDYVSQVTVWLAHVMHRVFPPDLDGRHFLISYACIGLVAALLSFARSRIFSSSYACISNTLQTRVVRRIFGAPVSYFDRTSSSTLLQVMSSDQHVVDHMLGQSVESVLLSIAQVMAMILFHSTRHRAFVISLPLIAILFHQLNVRFIRLIKQLRALESALRVQAVGLLKESLKGAVVIRAYGRPLVSALERELYDALNAMNTVSYLCVCCERWMSLRLELCTLIATCALAVISVLMACLTTRRVYYANATLEDEAVSATAAFTGLGIVTGISARSTLSLLSKRISMFQSEYVSAEQIIKLIRETPQDERSAGGLDDDDAKEAAALASDVEEMQSSGGDEEDDENENESEGEAAESPRYREVGGPADEEAAAAAAQSLSSSSSVIHGRSGSHEAGRDDGTTSNGHAHASLPALSAASLGAVLRENASFASESTALRERNYMLRSCRLLLDVRHLSARYQSHLPYVLSDVNFTLRAGECVGLIGRTGNGKSTIFSALLQLMDDIQGEIRIPADECGGEAAMASHRTTAGRTSHTAAASLSSCWSAKKTKLNKAKHINNNSSSLNAKKKNRASDAMINSLECDRQRLCNNFYQLVTQEPFLLQGTVRSNLLLGMDAVSNPPPSPAHAAETTMMTRMTSASRTTTPVGRPAEAGASAVGGECCGKRGGEHGIRDRQLIDVLKTVSLTELLLASSPLAAKGKSRWHSRIGSSVACAPAAEASSFREEEEAAAAAAAAATPQNGMVCTDEAASSGETKHKPNDKDESNAAVSQAADDADAQVGDDVARCVTPAAQHTHPTVSLSGGAGTEEDALLYPLLDHVVMANGTNLSAGQRQLLCLARVLLHRPRVVLLDEISSCVDAQTELLVRRIIEVELLKRGSVRASASCHGEKETEKESPCGVLLIAHRLETIIALCDRVLVIDQGRCAAYLTKEQVQSMSDLRLYL